MDAHRAERLARLTHRFHRCRTDAGRDRVFALILRAVTSGRFRDREATDVVAEALAQSLDPSGRYRPHLPEGWKIR